MVGTENCIVTLQPLTPPIKPPSFYPLTTAAWYVVIAASHFYTYLYPFAFASHRQLLCTSLWQCIISNALNCAYVPVIYFFLVLFSPSAAFSFIAFFFFPCIHCFCSPLK